MKKEAALDLKHKVVIAKSRGRSNIKEVAHIVNSMHREYFIGIDNMSDKLEHKLLKSTHNNSNVQEHGWYRQFENRRKNK